MGDLLRAEVASLIPTDLIGREKIIDNLTTLIQDRQTEAVKAVLKEVEEREAGWVAAQVIDLTPEEAFDLGSNAALSAVKDILKAHLEGEVVSKNLDDRVLDFLASDIPYLLGYCLANTGDKPWEKRLRELAHAAAKENQFLIEGLNTQTLSSKEDE